MRRMLLITLMGASLAQAQIDAPPAPPAAPPWTIDGGADALPQGPADVLGPREPVVDADGRPTASAMDDAVRRTVAYLVAQQAADGGWGHARVLRRPPGVVGPAGVPVKPNAPAGADAVSDPEGGRSALVTFALLSAGEDPASPHMAKALQFLKRNPVERTYHVAARTCVYSMLPTDEWDEICQAHGKWLLNAVVTEGANAGLYTYTSAGARPGMAQYTSADMSNSHYGVLGAYYAADAGLKVSKDYWRLVELGWHRGQKRDGGWGYTIQDPRSYGSMTAAGVATLYATYDYLHAADERNLRRKSERNQPLEAGLKWLADHFAVDHNPGKDPDPRALQGPPGNPVRPQRIIRRGGTYVHYMLFEYARVGEASGLTKFGEHPWFENGATYLLQTQSSDGSWTGSDGVVVDTAHALLFLARGRAPVAVQKLQHGGRWNNRSRDVANFNRWLRRSLSSQTKWSQTNWQILPPDAEPEQWREAPLLYVASDEAVPLNDADLLKLKRYVEQGGTLLLAAEGNGAAFTADVENKLQGLFAGYTFRDLPPEHCLFTAELPHRTLQLPVRGLSNGVRELAILLPKGDVPASWQTMQSPRDIKKDRRAQPFLLGGAIVNYATDGARLKLKGQGAWVERNTAAPAQHHLNLARLAYKGNWDPEPGGWERIGNILANKDRVDLHARQAQLGTDPLKGEFRVAHLTATGPIDLLPEQKDALRSFVEYDGLLLVDAAGGGTAAAESLEKLLAELFPDAKLDPLPADHPIYTAAGTGGKPIKEVDYRTFARGKLGATTAPRLKHFTTGGRITVVYSAEDLSAGIVGNDINGVIGYTPDSATDLMRNILLWARTQ